MSDIVERLSCLVDNPSAWDTFDQYVSDSIAEAAAEITRLRSQVAEQEARAAKAEQALAGLRVMADRVFNALTAWKRDAADWDDNISREIDVMVCEALAGYQPDDAKLVSSAILARAGASSPTPPNTQPSCANGGESKPENAR